VYPFRTTGTRCRFTLTKWLGILPLFKESGAISAPSNWVALLGTLFITQFDRGTPYFWIGEIDRNGDAGDYEGGLHALA